VVSAWPKNDFWYSWAPWTAPAVWAPAGKGAAIPPSVAAFSAPPAGAQGMTFGQSMAMHQDLMRAAGESMAWHSRVMG
jgi:hypothetical protein